MMPTTSKVQYNSPSTMGAEGNNSSSQSSPVWGTIFLVSTLGPSEYPSSSLVVTIQVGVILLVTLAVVLFTHHGGLLQKKLGLLVSSTAGDNTKSLAPSQQRPPVASKTTTTKKLRGPICPFSAETDFIVEMAESLPPTPLDMYESWVDETSADFGKPLGARWLNAGISGQDTPGILRAGLKRLPDSKFFLVQEPFRMKEELLMKKNALDDPIRFPKVYVSENDSFPAQEEVLDLFLSYLPRRYPNLYTYNPSMGTLYVTAIDTTFVIDEWRAKNRALELCERIVQEDLILMRPPKVVSSTDNSSSNSNNHPGQYEMAAAAVVFSFSELQAKLGQPVKFIHAPVPGYDKHLRRSLDLTFSKLLKVEQPMWRNNWGIAPTGELDAPLYGSTGALDSRTIVTVPTVDEIKAMFIKVEYQTIRRLPHSGYLLFTVKTMADSMSALEDVPLAAQCLAASIRGMSPDMRKYKGIENDSVCVAVLEYLDSIANGSILMKGKGKKAE